jgi:hypothetical protein
MKSSFSADYHQQYLAPTKTSTTRTGLSSAM